MKTDQCLWFMLEKTTVVYEQPTNTKYISLDKKLTLTKIKPLGDKVNYWLQLKLL